MFREALNTYLQHSAFRVIYIMGTLYPLTLVSLLAAIFVNKEQMAGTNARAFYTSGLLFTIAHVVPAWVAGEFRKAIEGLDAAGAKIASKGKGESDSRDEQLAASMGKWVRLNQWRLLFVNLPAWGLIATATMACVTSK